MPPHEPVPYEQYALLLSHFDLLWKTAGVFLGAVTTGFVWLGVRFVAQSVATVKAVENNTAMMESLRDEVVRGRA